MICLSPYFCSRLKFHPFWNILEDNQLYELQQEVSGSKGEGGLRGDHMFTSPPRQSII